MNDYNLTSVQLDPMVFSRDVCARDIIEDPLLNKSTAFTPEERDVFGLHGLLPANVETLEEQVARRIAAVRALSSDLDRYVYLRDLQDTDETLYYAIVTQHLEELLPMIYTPTVGLGCQKYSHIYRRPRGLFLTPEHRDHLDEILANPRFDNVECIVVTDGERILGLGDQGAGGMGIPIGKLAIYSGCGGIDPAATLPIMLDVGTNNADCLADPFYIGWRHERVRGQEYDDFLEAFITAVEKRWPNVLLQWEDFHKNNANRMLARYRDRLCSFNDDIQGTASVATGALLAAVRITGTPLKQQRIAILGGGSAGTGIADLIRRAMVEEGLSEEEACSRFYIVDRFGLLTEETADLEDFQRPFAQRKAAMAGWKLDEAGTVSLLDVMRNAHPTVLVGVSGQAGLFTEQVIREMASHVERPIVFPLSNPTACIEARPTDVVTWTDGRAVVGTGSPFAPFGYQGRVYHFAQTNNSYIFPGVGLGVLAVGAKRVTDTMFLAAAKALAEMSTEERLLPALSRMREVSYVIAVAVAVQARAEKLAPDYSDAEIEHLIRAKIWQPEYRPYVKMEE